MADDKKKRSLLDDIADGFKDATKDLIEDGKKQLVSHVVGAAMDTIDMFDSSLKRGVTNAAYRDGNVPEVYRKRINDTKKSTSGRENYGSYYYNTPKSREADSVREDATKVRAIFKDSKQEAQDMIDRIIEKIDNDPNNVCTVGKLYSWNGISSSSMMLWKYGWSERDKTLFDVQQVTTGENRGRWILVLPTPHRTS